jgi:hypothetical protein
MSKLFRADPGYAAELLSDIRRDGSPEELAILLRQMQQLVDEDCVGQAHAGERERE